MFFLFIQLNKYYIPSIIIMIYFIEGARNVGKTFLIDKLREDYRKNNIPLDFYKFPFNRVHEAYTFIEAEDARNDSLELFYMTLGYTVTLLDLAHQNQLKHDIIIDRGVFSDLVFGVQANRTSKKNAIAWWNEFLYTYKDLFKTIYIYSDNTIDNRNKDEWSVYDIKETHNLYMEIFDKTNYKPIMFKNEYNEESINSFINIF